MPYARSHLTLSAALILGAVGVSACGGKAVQRIGDDNGGGTSSGSTSSGSTSSGGVASGGGASGGASTGGIANAGGTLIGAEWALQFGTSSDDWPYAVGVDANGDVYVTGRTGGAMSGQTSSGERDVFLNKYDTNGAPLWSGQFGSNANDAAYTMALDPEGNVILGGSTFGALPGQTGAGITDAFVRKVDSFGNELWTRQFGTEETEEARSVAVSADGDIYVVGRTSGVLPYQITYGSADAFLRKYDAAGFEQWTLQFGTSDWDAANAVTVLENGDVYVAGNFRAPPGGDTAAMTAFLHEYDAEGGLLWAEEFDKGSVDAWAMWTDEAGAVRVAGRKANGPSGSADAFMHSHYGEDGWDNVFGTNGDDELRSASVWPGGNTYVAGRTTGAFDGFINAGADDVFVRRYDRSGEETTWQLGTDKEDATTGVAASPFGGAYVVGYTTGTFPGQQSSGLSDGFLIKLP